MESKKSISEEESKGTILSSNAWLCFTHAHMESKESGEDDKENGVEDYPRQGLSKDSVGIEDDEEARTMSKHSDTFRHEAILGFLAHQRAFQGIPKSTIQLLKDHSRLWEASTQLTKEIKQGDLDLIVWAHVAEMIGFLNLYTDKKMKYF